MKNAIADARNQSPKQNSLKADVKNAIQLALDEGGWSRFGQNKKPKVSILENESLEGDSGMHWTIDLAVIDNKGKPFMVIFCIDFTTHIHIENALTKTAAACQDLYSIDARMVLVVGKDKHENENKKLLGYDRLFESIHADVIPWNSKYAFELIVDLLHSLKRNYQGSANSIKSVRDTANNLTDKYPDLFIDNRQIPKKTNCLELLKQIKEYDLHQNFGEIIKDALSQDGVCQSLVGTKLSSISDAKLEELLKEYLEQQK